MRKTLFLFAVVAFAFIGCGGNTDLREKRGGGDQGGLGDADYQRVTTLNALQSDNIEARKVVYAHSFVEPLVSEKVSKLAKMISDNCSGDQEIPEEEMTGASNDQTIGGSLCPISWSRNRFYNSGARSFYYNDDFEARTKAFTEISPITRRQVQGSITTVISGATKNINGVITINQFQVQGLGAVKGSITLQSQYTGNRGTGSLNMHLTVFAKTQVSAAIVWEVPKFEPKYYVNGRLVELKTFEELFSAFDLTKIMANSLKMR
jgi:hypothetical protein